MPRVRLSTTVDAQRLATCRRLLKVTDSKLIDRALAALLDELEAEAEIAAIEAQPYDRDPELAWEPPPNPPLPYDGKIPADVLKLAAQRRRTRGRGG